MSDDQVLVSGTHSIGVDGRGEVQLMWTPLSECARIQGMCVPCLKTVDPDEAMSVTLTRGKFACVTTLQWKENAECGGGMVAK